MAKRAKNRGEPGNTRAQCLAVAIRLIQERGYNGFSFKDIAGELGISHVAVHHHFATKADLVVAALQHYSDAFTVELAAIDARNLDATEALGAYVRLFQATLRDGQRICLCGMLTAELMSLPASAKPHLRGFYERNEAWLKTVLQRIGVEPHRADSLAAAFLAALEGAMMLARAFDDEQRLTAAAEWLVGQLGQAPPKARPTRTSGSR